MPPDLKPARRIVDDRAGRLKLLAEGHCRICDESWRLERHHLVPRSLGGDDIDDNIVPLCPGCHGLFERGLTRRAIGHAIRMTLSTAELQYVLVKKGSGFLDRYYPPRG